MHKANVGRQFETYYHGTTKERAESILTQGPRDNFFMTPHPDIAEDYGEHIVQVEVPKGLNLAESHGEHHDDFNWTSDRENEGYHGYRDKGMGSDVILFHPKDFVRVTGVKGRGEW